MATRKVSKIIKRNEKMISKAKAVKGSVASINYIMKEEKQSFELCRNDLIGENGQEILQEFRETQALNTNCQNNTFSIVLSPSNDREHTAKELKAFTEKHLKNLGLENNQYIAYVHQNTNAPHVHIIANRIDYQGKALDDSYIGFKAQNSAQSIAQEYELTTAKELQKEKYLELSFEPSFEKEMKKEIRLEHNSCIKECENFEQYIEKMHERGYLIEPSINRGGKLQGFKVQDLSNEITFKASEIDKNFGIKEMLQKGISFEGMELQNGKIMQNTLSHSSMSQSISLSQPLIKIAELTLKVVEKGMELGM